MNFTHYKFDRLSSGDIIEVTLQGSAANVRLMNNSNFQSYKNGRRHQYFGGLVKQSPFRLNVPSSGQWHVTVDMAGLRGQVRSSARVLKGALPVAREASLASVPSLVHRDQPDPNFPDEDYHKEFDVFISHASEDKDKVVRPLAEALKNRGLDVWYDEYELKIGDSLRRKIDSGLAKSKFGIVVLSKPFLSKGWTNYELDGLVTKSVTQEQILLPIWHNISKQEVIDYSPSLADKLGRNTAMHTVDEIAAEIAEVINAA